MSRTRRPGLLHGGEDLGEGGDVAAGEDVLVDEGLVVGGGGGLRHGVEQHDAVGGEEAVGGAEEGRVLRQADVLEHADGDDVVEAALDLAVVLDAEAHAVGEAGGGGALGGDAVLLLGEGDAGDVGAGDAGEVERHAAPAAADVEDAGAGADEELGGDQALLGELGLVERHVGVLEEGAGILHVAVEEEPVEPLVEVVVVGDVGARRLEADGAQDRRVGDAAPEVVDPGEGGGDLGAQCWSWRAG